MVAPQGCFVGFLLLRLGAGAAVVVSGVHGCLYVQLRAGFIGRQTDFGIAQSDNHVLLGIGLVGDLPHGGDGVGFAHAADIYAGNGDVVQNLAAVGVAGGADTEDNDDGNDHHQRNTAGGYHQHLPVLINKAKRLIQKRRRCLFRQGFFLRKHVLGVGNQTVGFGQQFGGLRVGELQLRFLRRRSGYLRLACLGRLLAGELAEALFNFALLLPVGPGVGKFAF